MIFLILSHIFLTLITLYIITFDDKLNITLKEQTGFEMPRFLWSSSLIARRNCFLIKIAIDGEKRLCKYITV